MHEVRIPRARRAGSDRGGERVLGVVDQDVGCGQEGIEGRRARCGVRIDDATALVGVSVSVGVGRPLVIGYGGALDLDDVCAEVGEHPPAQRPTEIGEVDHAHVRQRLHQSPPGPGVTVVSRVTRRAGTVAADTA